MKRKKKILHIQVLPKLSGVQRVSLDIFNALPSDEWEKTVLFSKDIPEEERRFCEEEFIKAGVTVLYCDTLHREICADDRKALKYIYNICRKQKYDIVHTNSTKPGIIGRIGASLAGCKVIHTVHGLSFHKFVKFPRWQFYWACEMVASLFCKKIVSVNKYYLRYFRAFRRKTNTIYNGVVKNSVAALPDNRYSTNGKSLVYVGRLDTPKDPLTLLEAIKLVRTSIPDVHLNMVGDGEFYEQCVSFIKDNRLESNVTLLGWQNNPTQFYEDADIFVGSSIYEAFGLTFVEAGLTGLPTVSTNVEGIPEVVEDGVTGILCSPRDPQTLADNIIKLIEDRSLRERMGRAAYKRSSTLFTVKNMTDGYLKIYKSLLED